MDRKEILSSPVYWETKAQMDLYDCAVNFMKQTNRNRTQLAEYLGVTKGYVSQILNGDYDHRMSKFFELALAFGFVPQIKFVPIDDVIAIDEAKESRVKWNAVTEPTTTAQIRCDAEMNVELNSVA